MEIEFYDKESDCKGKGKFLRLDDSPIKTGDTFVVLNKDNKKPLLLLVCKNATRESVISFDNVSYKRNLCYIQID